MFLFVFVFKKPSLKEKNQLGGGLIRLTAVLVLLFYIVAHYRMLLSRLPFAILQEGHPVTPVCREVASGTCYKVELVVPKWGEHVEHSSPVVLSHQNPISVMSWKAQLGLSCPVFFLQVGKGLLALSPFYEVEQQGLLYTAQGTWCRTPPPLPTLHFSVFVTLW